MGASEGVNFQPCAALMRSPSSLGESDDSEFEFGFSEVSSHDEPPPSPKLHNFSTTHSYVEHIYTAAPKIHSCHLIEDQSLDGAAAESDTIDADGVTPDQSQKVMLTLRSLMLERRESDQLPPLDTVRHDRNKSLDRTMLRSLTSSSSSDASSSSSSPSTSSPEHHKKKSKRWPLMLEFWQTKKSVSTSKAEGQQHMVNHSPEISSDHNDAKGGRRGSMSSGGSALVKQMEGAPMSKCARAAVSPAASPSRAAAPLSPAKGPAAGAHHASRPASPTTPASVKRRPMSPHAHYQQQQRTRADELRRRTFLPYRQSLFASAFRPHEPRPPRK